MSERQQVEERLHRKEAEILALEEKIKAARVYVQALRDILKLWNPEDGGGKSASSPDSNLRSGSAVAQARNLIIKRGAPVHVNDLLTALGRDVTRESRASLTSSLSQYVRRGEIFTRPAPNTFGLIELGHHSVEVTEPEPPKGFGQLSAKPAQAATLVEDDSDIPF